jgi:N-acetylglucosamine kinase-like BadF-type ATPase
LPFEVKADNMTKQSSHKLYMGIDGGGTKTLGALADETGTILAECKAGPSSIVGVPSTESCAVLQSVRDTLCERAGVRPDAIAWLGLGLNGVDFPEETIMQHGVLSRVLAIAPERFILVNDGIAALWGATPAPAAAIVQHGTGFTAAYRIAYGEERPFDNLDAGRFYDLRLEALALVARMIDGRVAVSPLKEAILACLDHPEEKDYGEIVFLRKYSQPQLAAIQPAVLRVADARDAAAQSIVERAIADYVCTAVTIVRKTGSSRPDVVFGGGRLLSAPEWFMKRIVDGVLRDCPGARIRRPGLSPAIGAVIMAAHAGGCAPTRFFQGVCHD